MYHKGSKDQPKGFGFGGFSMSSVAPPTTLSSAPASSKSFVPGHTLNYTNFVPGSRGGGSGRYGHINIGKKRVKCEEEYFDDDEGADNEYLPAPGSPGFDGNKSDDDDPLDAFMAGIEKEVHDQDKDKNKSNEDSADKYQDAMESGCAKDVYHDWGVREDIDSEDVQEAYFRYMEENPTAGLVIEDDQVVEYDEDGNAIIPEKNKIIDPLPPIDHSEIDYKRFEKNFYTPHPDIEKLSVQEVDTLRRTLSIKVSGISPAKPVTSFAHFGFDENLMESIRKSEYTSPTPIQAQSIPVALNGRDIIGIAKTGSGKTAAFVWPMLVHILDQPELQAGDGPIGVILAPTRELSQQIYQEAKKFGKVYNIHVVCAYGGGNMWEQTKACAESPEIIVATPGRLIDLIKRKATNLRRVTFVVYDEADRMFDMGFEPQVRSIADHVRPDRQTLLFSATFRRRIESLARDILTDPVRIIQGELGEANEDVTQIVEVLPPGPAKWTWLVKRLVGFTSIGSVLIFVTRKSNAEDLATNLKDRDLGVLLLHGDMSQIERNQVITSFKKRESPIMVATDVAARGLDIPSIKTVINYDVARDIDTHTHRIGRTGRAGEKGTAYTLVTIKDKEFACLLVRNLEGANQTVPQPLLDLAMKNPWFQKNRFKQTQAKIRDQGGSKSRDRMGLGAAGSTSLQESCTVKGVRASMAGQRSDRLEGIKQAFAAQYRSNFVASTDTQNATSSIPSNEGHGTSRRKKSRWN